MAKDETLLKVVATLRSVLQLGEARALEQSTPLLGGIAEFDSLAVASVLIAIEEEFGLEFHDDDISAELFITVGTLADFVDSCATLEVAANSLQAEFLSTPAGRLFVLRRDPPGGSDRCVLVVPPFAEELNRVRPLVTQTAQSLVKHGISTCVADLRGTGDSDCEFSEARWSGWLTDLSSVVSHLHNCGYATIDLLGIRLGALLAMNYAQSNTKSGRLIVWDPVLDARNYVDRFLLTRVMAAMISGEKESVETLRERLAQNETIEVGGYALHPELVAELDAVSVPAAGEWNRLYWISRDSKAAARAAELDLKPGRVFVSDYPPYWASAEATEADSLIQMTCDCLVAADA